jgi:phospholipase C
MATTQTANVFITNTTDGTAQIALSHQNDSNGTQSGSWAAEPGQTVGPLVVVFETGIGSYGILDWWTVTMTVSNGTQPGIYQNTGTAAFPHWKECQLQHQDAGRDLVFTVGTSQFATNLASGGCTDGMARIADYSPITNVFVLMLENRSFDHMFGRSGIPGLTVPADGTANSYNGTAYPVAAPAPTSMTSDPGHEFADTVEQLAGPGATYPQGGPYPPITMSGFAANYATVSDEDVPAPTPDHIGDVMMEFDTPTQLPTSHALATSFAICDHWYSSMPGPTWPNRMFVHGASSAGLDHTPSTAEILEWESVHGFAFPHGSIYDALTSANLKWRIYNDNTDAYSDNPQNGSAFGAVPQVSALKGVTLLDINSLTHFAADLQGPYPYQYTFIEPNYGDITSNTYVGGSSQHPMDDVYGGEALIKAVYEAIRNSPLWSTSLLIITYDEHGGFYDHLPPVAATPPNDGSSLALNDTHFPFDLYGVRVPAIVVSPLIEPGAVDHTVYDHTSVLATVERLFGLPALTERDGAANDLRGLLTLTTPRTDCPPTIPGPVAASAKPLRTDEALAADDAQPVADSGNLAGFLGATRKAAYETFATTPQERAQVDAEYEAIGTRGDARAFVANVVAKADRFKQAGPLPTPYG